MKKIFILLLFSLLIPFAAQAATPLTCKDLTGGAQGMTIWQGSQGGQPYTLAISADTDTSGSCMLMNKSTRVECPASYASCTVVGGHPTISCAGSLITMKVQLTAQNTITVQPSSSNKCGPTSSFSMTKG